MDSSQRYIPGLGVGPVCIGGLTVVPSGGDAVILGGQYGFLQQGSMMSRTILHPAGSVGYLGHLKKILQY